MAPRIIIFASIFTVLLMTGSYGARQRILGSRDAVPGEFPHMVSLQLELPMEPNFHLCGGSIIGERWILSTAKCMYLREDFFQATKFFAMAGEHDLSISEGTEQAIEIQVYYIHSKYDKHYGGPYDISLVFLKSPLTFNKRVAPINLPSRGRNPVGEGTISGWGDTVSDDEPQIQPILQTSNVTVIDHDECSELMKEAHNMEPEEFTPHIDDTNICTKVDAVNEGSLCEGDAGSPLISKDNYDRNELIGLASWWLEPCGAISAPTVYVKVSLFLDWITLVKNTQEND